MADRILESFLQRQYQEGLELAQSSDLVDIFPAVPAPGPLPFVFQAGDPYVLPDATPPDRYIARFRCKGLVRTNEGEIREADEFTVGIWFPSDYLRRVDPYRILTWFGPGEVFHPNVCYHGPFICVGRMTPGTPLTDLLYQCFEIITYHKVTMREDDALNKAACAWAREHQDRFPVDRRPLRRRQLELTVDRPNE
jgi:hypothetical protein